MHKMYFVIFFFLLSFFSFSQEEDIIMTEEVKEVKITGIDKFSQNGKYGLKDYDTNTVLLPAIYGTIYKRAQDVYELWGSYKYGLYNSKLKKIILPVEYNSVSLYATNGDYIKESDKNYIIIIEKDGKKGLLDNNLNPILAIDYEHIEVSKGYVFLRKDGKEGVYFFNEKEIPLKYDEVFPFYPSNCFSATLNNVKHFYNESGELLVDNCKIIEEYSYRWSSVISSNILITTTNGKSGVYNATDKRFIVPINYEHIKDEYEQYFIVSKKSKYGMVNRNNKIIIPFVYDELSFLKPNNIKDPLIGLKNGKYGLVTIEKLLTDFLYDDIRPLNSYYKAKRGNKYIILDKEGKSISNELFDNVGSFYDNKAVVFDDGKYGYINNVGKIVVPIMKPLMARGYDNLDDLFKNFVLALKSKNDDELMKFAKDIVFDEYTSEFFNRISYRYRGFPFKMSNNDVAINKASEKYYRSLKEIRDILISSNELESLVYKGLQKKKLWFLG